MSRIIGIDLGTTNSLVAAVDAGIPFVIPDAEGRRLTPSVVYFPPGGEAPLVGAQAQRVRALHPAETIYSVKRFIGRRFAELAENERDVAYPIAAGSAGEIKTMARGRPLAPEEISALVLRKLKAEAEAYFSAPVERAVITVPAYFNDAQRSATKRAGEMAGFIVERIINEPTAAALSYGLDRLGEKSKVAVYDLGGGTFDLSILELREGIFQVLATHGDTRLGGDDLDRRVAEHLLSVIQSSGGPDLREHPLAVARIREAAEAAKIQLSVELETQITLPFLTPDFSFQHALSRDTLETLTRDIIERTRSHCWRALADARLEARDLDQVILVGGQTRMPLVREMTRELFGCSDFEAASGNIRIGQDYHRPEGPMLNTSQNPDEAVALGAAIQAEILSGGFKNMLLLDVTPLSLGIETFGGLMNVIIPRNSTIPIKSGEVFTTAVDNQRSMLIHVLQGERERARDNWSLGRFALEFEPARRGVPRVGVQFEIDANGILRVLARDIKTGREQVLEMKSAVDVSDEDVQKMVEESVEHAFTDLAARRWIEAKLKADQTIEATRKGLLQAGEELPADIRQEIERQIEALRQVLHSADPASQTTGDLNRLKEAHARLDAATQPLASLLMDRAMELMLKRKGILPAD